MSAGTVPPFAALLLRHRRAAGLTQQELAARALLSAVTVSALERGVNRQPHRETVERLAAALALPAGDHAALVAAARRGVAPIPPPRGGQVPPEGAPLPLVGRAAELAALERHLRGEGPPLLLLAGEPGIGKSRLLQVGATRAIGRGLVVLEGGCQRRGGQEPYAPLLGAVQRCIATRPPARLRADLRGCAWLVRLLPELAGGPIEPPPAWTLPPEQERRLLFEAVGRFLANVAGPGGVLLALDDLQWAGPDALDLLQVLVRSAAGLPMRLLGAYRDTEVHAQDPLAVTLADLAHAGLAARRLLSPLAPQEAAQLVTDLLEGFDGVGPDPRAEILRRAGGVPFFVVSCAKELRAGDGERDGAPRRADPDIGPWAVAQSVRQRVAVLPEGARAMLDAAAVVGRVVPHSLLGSVTGQPEAELFAALGAACRAGMLAEDGQTYQFTHDVIREVIEHDVGLAQRRALHRRVAEALEQQPGEPPVELLAYHYSRSEEQARALLYLEQAGDRASAQYAAAAAEGYYRELVARLEGLGRVPQTAAVREKLGAVLFTMAQFDAALVESERAAETYRRLGDVEGQARVTAQIGRMNAARATPEEGVARLQAFLATLGPRAPSAGQAALYAALGYLFLATCRGAERESVAAAERAAELARAVGDEAILADADVCRGGALLYLGRTAEALGVLEDASSRAEAVGDVTALIRLLHTIGTIHLYAGALEQSWGCQSRALALAERVGDPTQLMYGLSQCGEVLVLRGDWSAARRDLERAMDLERVSNWTLHRGHASLKLARLHLAEGEWTLAVRYAEECLPWAERTGDLPDTQGLLAEADLLAGRPDAALARLTLLLDHPGTAEIELTRLLPLVAWAHLELGEAAEGAGVVATCIRRAQAQHYRLALVDALRVQAQIQIRQRQWAEAERSLDEGITLALDMPYPHAEARLLLLRAQLRAAHGESEKARERLEAALAIFRRLGALKDAERTEHLLAALG